MHTFRVWAPTSSTVDLVLGHSLRSDAPEARRLPMDAGDFGWWQVSVEDAEPGDDYAFSLDGGNPIPDPCTAWQPEDVHGPSRLFDPAAHRWRDEDFIGCDARGAVIYELHLGTFTDEGTLDAAIDKLDHLVELGVDLVELMPVAAFPGRWGWGYDGVHLYAVHDQYGGPAALQRFVDAAHRKGLAVGLDVVYNHLGPSGNYLLLFGPYFTDKHHTPWGMAVNLDADDSGPVRRYLIDNALRWFRDFHIDALRLDAVHELKDDSERHFLAQLSDETAQLATELDRPLSLIAESDLNDPVMVTPTADGGLGMTAQWDDDIHHALHALLTGERQGYYDDFGSLQTLAKTLTSVFLHDGGFSSFRGREWGAPVDRAETDGHRFLAYTTTHDQTGNRGVGDRLSATLTLNRQAIAAAVVLTSPYTPMLFMGEEFAATTPWQFFTDHSEPELAEAVRNGRRAEFAAHGWNAEEIPDPQSESTRDASVLRWADTRSCDGARLLAWYRALIALRRALPELMDSRLDRVQVDYERSENDSGAGWFVVRRGQYRLVVNLADHTRTVPLDRAPQFIQLSFSGAKLRPRGVRLPADGVALVAIDDSPTVADAVSRYLTDTTNDLRTAVSADDVHDMRVSCRRIRSILRAHAKAWQGETRARSEVLADRAREIARALGADRDHEVAGEVIDDWAEADGWDAQERLDVLDALYPTLPEGSTPAPKPAVPHGTTALSPHDARFAALELTGAVVEFVATAQWRARAHVPASIGLAGYRLRAANRIAQRARLARNDRPDEDPQEHWHLVRKAAKRLRYAAEAGAAVSDEGAKDVVAAAKNVQTVIGDLQDARLVRDRLELASGPAIETARRRADDTIDSKGEAIAPALQRLSETVPGLQLDVDLEPDQS